jgi:hypothetical protein
MIAIYRWILGLLKKEHVLRTNYHKSHPHFLLYIGLDALLSFALVFGGFQIFNPRTSSAAQNLIHAGGVALSANDFVNHAREMKVDTFWLGAISGYDNTINHKTPGVVDVYYVPQLSVISKMEIPIHPEKNYRYEVKTYKNQGV